MPKEPSHMTRTTRRSTHDRVLRSSTRHKERPSPSDHPKPKRRRPRGDPWTPRRRKPASQTPRPALPPPEHYTCRICAEELPTSAFIQWVTMSRRRNNPHPEIPNQCLPHLCRRPRLKNDPVCKSCIGRSMTARLETVGARNLVSGCMDPACNFVWDFNYILKHLPAESLEGYNLGMLNVWKEKNRNLMLTCKNPNCGAIGLLDPFAPGYPQVSCTDCKTRMCGTCNVLWHKKMTCADYKALKVTENLTEPETETLQIMQRKDARRCPECYLVIEKDGGCDSMFCLGCKKYFNWQLAPNAVPGAARPPVAMHGRGWVHSAIRPPACEVDGLLKANTKVLPK